MDEVHKMITPFNSNWKHKSIARQPRRVSIFDSASISDSDSDLIPLQTIRRRHSGVPPKHKMPRGHETHKRRLSPLPNSHLVDSGVVPALHSVACSSMVPSTISPGSKTPATTLGESPMARKNNGNHPEYLNTPGKTREHLRIGDYSVEIGSVVGSGGFSSVYAVTDLALKKSYALKVVQLTSNVQEELRKNLLEEVRILESLTSVDHVIQLLAHNANSSQDQIYMLMELGQGDLRQILRTSTERTKPLDIDFVRYWGGQVLRAVDAVHSRNIVHADLKPANFIVVSGALKLCDFGIANPVPENTVSVRRSNAIGTLLYMAPETLRQNIAEPVYKVTKASDMWSCGIILYEMVYLSYPYSDRTYLSKAENSELDDVQHPKSTPGNSPVPLALHEVIRDCLNLDPFKRVTSRQAVGGAFFSPVSVDLEAVLSITRNAYRHGRQAAKDHHEEHPERLEELAKTLFKKLVKFNSGEL